MINPFQKLSDLFVAVWFVKVPVMANEQTCAQIGCACYQCEKISQGCNRCPGRDRAPGCGGYESCKPSLSRSYIRVQRPQNSNQTLISKFFKFCMVGGIGAGIQFVTIYLLTEKAHLYYLISTVLGIGIAVCWTFFANNRWTFKTKDGVNG